jgi:hypothetical protein
VRPAGCTRSAFTSRANAVCEQAVTLPMQCQRYSPVETNMSWRLTERHNSYMRLLGNDSNPMEYLKFIISFGTTTSVAMKSALSVPFIEVFGENE